MRKFPHIDALYQVIRAVKKLNASDAPDHIKISEPVKFRGTVKLHGTNAGVAVKNGEVTAQSRTRVITPEDDNMGFAAFVRDRAGDTILSIVSKLRAAFQIPDDHTVTLFGEWCGPGIQKGCGINMLSERQFVIFAVAIGDGEDAVFIDAVSTINRDASASVYPITEATTWDIDVDFNSEVSCASAAEIATAATLSVEERCPWAANFGHNGIGEGIVWIPIDEYWGRTDLFFKTKGGKHRGAKTRIRHIKVDPEKFANVTAFVDAALNNGRLEQGVDAIKEQGIVLEPRAIGPYLKWIAQDVMRECASELEESGMTWKDVGKSVNAKARNWFIDYLKGV